MKLSCWINGDTLRPSNHTWVSRHSYFILQRETIKFHLLRGKVGSKGKRVSWTRAVALKPLTDSLGNWGGANLPPQLVSHYLPWTSLIKGITGLLCKGFRTISGSTNLDNWNLGLGSNLLLGLCPLQQLSFLVVFFFLKSVHAIQILFI